jgi:hypothetical protein
MAIFLNNAPHTEKGAKLKLTAETEENCRVVYKRNDEGGAVFYGFWDSEADYTDEYVILPVKSTYKDISREYPTGTAFANVEGSSHDTKPSGYSWIGYFQACMVDEGDYVVNECCAENGKVWYYDDQQYDSYKRPCDDDDILVGGHIMPPENPAESDELPNRTGELGENSDVYLLPICQRHNLHGISGSHGAGYYMKLRHAMKAVILQGYCEPIQLQEMLADHAATV